MAAAWVALVDVDGSGQRKPSEGRRWAKHAETALARAGGDQEQQGELLHNVAAALRFLDRTDEALEHERRALALFERAFGPNHVRVANQRGSVANMLRFLARFDESRKKGEAVRAQREQLVGISTRGRGLAPACRSLDDSKTVHHRLLDQGPAPGDADCLNPPLIDALAPFAARSEKGAS